MKTITKTCLFVIMAAVFSLPMIQPSKAVSVDEAVSKIIDTVMKKASSSEDFKTKFCRKASFFSGTFSIRSGEGIACKNKAVAAMAEIMCKEGNLDDYANSHCHKNALAVLAGADPKAVLAQEVAGKVGKARELMCTKAGVLPPQLQAISSKACAGATPTAPAATPEAAAPEAVKPEVTAPPAPPSAAEEATGVAKLAGILAQKDPAAVCTSLMTEEEKLCANKSVAAFAVWNCTAKTLGADFDKFTKSNCYKSAYQVLPKDANKILDMSATGKVLEDAIKQGSDEVDDLVCPNKDKFTGTSVGNIATRACPAA